MEIYRLTGLGRALSHNIKSPPTPEWKVIHFLAKHGRGTKEQMSSYLGISAGQVSAALARLRFKRVVVEETGVTV